MWTWLRRIALTLVIFVVAVIAFNSSWFAAPPENPQRRLLSHRGVHQTFDRTDIDNDTCTAERALPADHQLMENTIPSMQAAFAAGADVVELDVAATTDGQLAVFHDWTLECRTNGSGPIRSYAMDELKALDIGYGYTSDGGKSFPLRGTGVGLMPTLDEVLNAIPNGKFLVNFKSRDSLEGEMLAARLADHPQWRPTVWSAYGGAEPTDRANALIPGLNGFSSTGMKNCLLGYLALGWTGYVPEPCRNTHVMVPQNLAWLAWGWPNRFHQRMQDAGSNIILIGPVSSGESGTSGIDTPELLSEVPADFDGYIWTNRIEIIGPLVKN